jgi:hypothetical protein
MKKSRVIQVFKSGDRTDPNNYRPTSVIPLVSKIMEKIVFKLLTAFPSANYSLFSKQYGFVRIRSVLFLIFKAFDSVDETALL